ncbi:MAG TPA: YfjI family protein [Streptosporangiaceae bacterium]|nr:YfjI family protein [Streptosporangiaceae bacterium]
MSQSPTPAEARRAAEATKPEPWEDLVPLGTRAPLPPFPVDTLPGYIAAMVTAVATEVQVPADLPGALAMGVLSTAAGGRAEVVVRGQWREPLNLYLASAMPPGSGKSPAFRLMCAPIFAAEQELREKAAASIMAAVIEREAAIAEADAQRRKAKAPGDIRDAVKAASMAEALAAPVMPRLTADDVVPEQAATIMADQGGRLAILSAEGTFFSVIMGRYMNGTPNVELALKGHAGDRVQVDRRGRAELIERPALTIATTVQPTVLREIAAKPAMRERGVLARFLLTLPPDLVGNREITPELVPDEVLHGYTSTVKALIVGLAEWTDPAVLTLTPPALKLHTEWRAEVEPRLRQGTGDLEALRDWASKLPGATARLAGLLHLAENPGNGPRMPVGEDTMTRAITQARYWAEHAMTAFGAMRAHPAIDDARAVLEWIRSRDEPVKPFTQRDVHRVLQRRFPTAPAAACALDVLEDHGYIRRAEVPRGPGRKPVIYDVHPRAVTN